MTVKFEYGFVPMGSVAPETIARNEFWLDVGNRVHPNIFDHHFDDEIVTSTAKMVLNHFQSDDYREKLDHETFKFITHAAPDLDGISAIWIFQKGLVKNIDVSEFTKLVNLITRHDQGYVAQNYLEYILPIIFYAEIYSISPCTDGEKVKYGCEVLDFIYTSYIQKDNAEISFLTSKAENIYKKARKDFLDDIETGHLVSLRHSSKPELQDINGFHVNNPKCTFFKHFIRNSTYQKRDLDFELLITSKGPFEYCTSLEMWRHIISVSPESNISLKGLGIRLENEEQIIENEKGVKLNIKRQRVTEGTGRFGSNVISPWYDGRGHAYTIVDSPALLIENKSIVASVIPPERIDELIMEWWGQN